MSRGIASATLTAAQARVVRPLSFYELQFTSGTIRIHNGVGDIPWGGNTWEGAGALIAASPIEEGEDGTAIRVSLQLSGVDPALVTIAEGEAIYRRTAICYIGALTRAGTLHATPDERWRGLMENIEISLGEVNTITLNVESELIRDRQAIGALFTDETQQRLYSGDTGFEFLSQVIDATDIHWGPGGARVFIGGRDPWPTDQIPVPADRRRR